MVCKPFVSVCYSINFIFHHQCVHSVATTFINFRILNYPVCITNNILTAIEFRCPPLFPLKWTIPCWPVQNISDLIRSNFLTTVHSVINGHCWPQLDTAAGQHKLHMFRESLVGFSLIDVHISRTHCTLFIYRLGIFWLYDGLGLSSHHYFCLWQLVI